MSDEMNKKSERSIVGLTVREMTQEEWEQLAKLEQVLIQLGVRERPTTGQESEELEHIVEAIREFYLVRDKGVPVSSTMALATYLKRYSSIIRTKSIREILDGDFI